MIKAKKFLYFSKKAFNNLNLNHKPEEINIISSHQEILLNWKLSRVHVTPRNKVSLNAISPENKNDIPVDDKTPVIKTPKEIGSLKFSNYLRKMGKLISFSPEVFVQTGKISNINVRCISNEKDLLSAFISKIEGVNKDFEDEPVIDVLMMTKGELNVGPFILADKDKKVILTNSKNSQALHDFIAKF